MKFNVSPVGKMKTAYGLFNIQAFEDRARGITHAALWMGDLSTADKLLVRIQSSCVTSTAFASGVCDCKEQMDYSFGLLASRERGLFLYMDEEGRGHGMREKITTVSRMNKGDTTVSAFTNRGLLPDVRDYKDAITLIQNLVVSRDIELLTNNPNKVEALVNAEYRVERIAVTINIRDEIKGYLSVKKQELGHLIDGV